MRADDLILFSEIVELGSFSKAAEKNNLTSSVVSKRISRLEQAVGVPLLYRTTRKLTLTEAGSVLAKGARSVKQLTRQTLDEVAGLGESVSGQIKMSVPTISGELLLADAVSEFCARHPGLSIEMSLNNSFVDLIADGYDLVIRTGYLEDSSLIARHLIDSQWVVCASPAYLAKQGKPASPQQLTQQNHNCLLYTHHTSGASEWAFNSEQGEYLVKATGSFATDNAAALRKAALAGYGVAYVPRCLVYPDLVSGELIDLFPGQVAKKLGVYAVYPYSRQPPNKIKLLIEHIRDSYLAIAHYF